MSSLTLENNSLVLRTPYDPGLVAALKSAIDYSDRRWDSARKAWLIAPQHGKLIADLIQAHLGEMVNVPQNTVSTETMRTLDIRYIGTTKERADGTYTAFGYCNRDWSAIFPESTLRDWFDGIHVDHQPNSKQTLYSILGCSRDAKPEEVKSSYRKMAKIWHPDVAREANAADQFMLIQEAYKTLSSTNLRARYDAGLKLEATLDPRLKSSYAKQPYDGYRSPLRCGYLLAEGVDQLGRFVVKKILDWQDITNAFGQVLATTWPAGADHFVETWV